MAPPLARRYQGLWVSIGVLCLVLALVAVSLNLVGPTSDLAALYASLVPYGLPAALVGWLCLAIALLRARRRLSLSILAALCAGLLALQLSWAVPAFIRDDRPATTGTTTLLSLNMLAGQADAAQLLTVAKAADIVVLVEFTEPAHQAMATAGWDQEFPYSFRDPRVGIGGSAIYSRYRVTDKISLAAAPFQQLRATLDVPEVGPVTIFATHPCNPLCGDDRWIQDHDQLREVARPYLGQNLILAGDFNAISSHRPMRRLAADGLADAGEVAGSGWLPTYPATRFIPPLVPIDHVLISSSLTATKVSTFRVDGTDHLGLIAQIARTS